MMSWYGGACLQDKVERDKICVIQAFIELLYISSRFCRINSSVWELCVNYVWDVLTWMFLELLQSRGAVHLWCLVVHVRNTGWRYMDMLSTLLALCVGNPPVTGGFPSQRASMVSFDVFLAIKLKKPLNKQLGCQWFEMSWCSCHWHVTSIKHQVIIPYGIR